MLGVEVGEAINCVLRVFLLRRSVLKEFLSLASER